MGLASPLSLLQRVACGVCRMDLAFLCSREEHILEQENKQKYYNEFDVVILTHAVTNHTHCDVCLKRHRTFKPGLFIVQTVHRHVG